MSHLSFAGAPAGPAPRDPLMDCLHGHQTEDEGLTFEQTAAAKYQRMQDGQRKAADRQQKAEESRLRKSPKTEAPPGLTAAIHEWSRALLGLPRQSTSPSSSQVDVSQITKHHLPAPAKITEVEAWNSHNKNCEDFIEYEIKQKMAQKLATNPKASNTYKAELKKIVTKEVVAEWANRAPKKGFMSRVALATTSVQSYEPSRLSLAEASLAAAGFPRLTLQWNNTINTPWNSAVLNCLLAAWLECYNARGVPDYYDIPQSDETPKLAKEILTKWLSGKRAKYSQEENDKALIATPGGAEKYAKKVVESKDRKAMKALRTKVAQSRLQAILKHIKGFTDTHQLLLVMDEVHSDTETVPATPAKPAHQPRIKLAWRKPELDQLIHLADEMARKNPDSTKAQKTNAAKFQAARAEYSPAAINPEDQLTPQQFPKCLIREEFLNQLGELEVEGLELSEKHIELQTLNEHLMRKVGNKYAMAVAS
ncbi:uncharacterized protein MELLADRAFT_87870 [Melampsora larici-populina 98AG31]|uniref:Uncharacterized protein n=1 Tax=Melampsora larici-populina (strain 98AG31 / pathotype 3-4-7) TaxID=747676 RepID=F4RPT9_MELLP|nr:uncharacterized protein MELLADRAFT_87870 [Melampsora larici-populina 98AG31]EGG05604.1 hypothetical protein MELLADRAFT_87870 [Melampsora larici-populina 98AG31]